MASKDLAAQISKLVNRSRADVAKSVAALDAEQLINIKVALDQKQSDNVMRILDQKPPPSIQQLDPRETLREINKIGRNHLKNQEPMDRVWELIGHLKSNDWDLVWPAIDRDILIALYFEVSDQETDSISKEQSAEIYNYARQFVSEHAIYQGNLVEVTIPRGPNNTVGIKLNGVVSMVERSQLKHLDEHVMGMTAMPSLGRIQQLAGIPFAQPSHTAPAHEEFTEDATDRVDHERAVACMNKLIRSVSLIKQLMERNPDYEAALLHCEQAQKRLVNLKQILQSGTK